jgi:N-acetylglucosaminyldiphosphoundecaprenol N-acetyl-beta-D-mannosaminyltransferase
VFPVDATKGTLGLRLRWVRDGLPVTATITAAASSATPSSSPATPRARCRRAPMVVSVGIRGFGYPVTGMSRQHARVESTPKKANVSQMTQALEHGNDPVAPPRVDFDFEGLRLAGLEVEAAVEWITAQARARKRAVVVTPNINHLHLVQVSDQARYAIERADLQLADGWPIVAASRILGQPLPGRVAGIDLVERLVDGESGFKVAILGGPDDAATRLADRARRSNEVVLVDELRPGWDQDERRSLLAQRIVDASPDLTLVGIGAPQQEILAHELKASVTGPIICCGAAIEVLAGMRPRAPRVVQRLGLEWAFRLAIEPRRLARRYVVGGTTFLRLLVSALRLRVIGRDGGRS